MGKKTRFPDTPPPPEVCVRACVLIVLLRLSRCSLGCSISPFSAEHAHRNRILDPSCPQGEYWADQMIETIAVSEGNMNAAEERAIDFLANAQQQKAPSTTTQV